MKDELTPFDQATQNAENFISTLVIQFGCLELMKLVDDHDAIERLGLSTKFDKTSIDRLTVINAQLLEDQLGVSA